VKIGDREDEKDTRGKNSHCNSVQGHVPKNSNSLSNPLLPIPSLLMGYTLTLQRRLHQSPSESPPSQYQRQLYRIITKQTCLFTPLSSHTHTDTHICTYTTHMQIHTTHSTQIHTHPIHPTLTRWEIKISLKSLEIFLVYDK